MVKKVMGKLKKLNGASVLQSMAMIIAVGVANRCCVVIFHQPEMPKAMSRLRKF